MNQKLRTGLIILISTVWAVNFVMPLFQHDYKPPAEINLAFMTVVGWLTAGYKNGTTPTVEPPPEPAPAPAARTPPRKRTTSSSGKKVAAKKTAAQKTGKKVTRKQPGRKGSGRR